MKRAVRPLRGGDPSDRFRLFAHYIYTAVYAADGDTGKAVAHEPKGTKKTGDTVETASEHE